MPSTEVTPDVTAEATPDATADATPDATADATADVATDVTADPADPEAHAGCPACRHELAAHDALGRRFCAATTSGTQERGCICAASTPVTPR